MKKYIFFIFCFVFQNNYAEQFVYPVADFNDGKQLMVLYQKSLSCVELWIWDVLTQHASKGLSSFLTPANLRMMPSGKGFSFIDQGYIKIKEFVKRSPRTLPIYEPIGLFSSMNWIDDETFYFVAREGDFFQIFQGDLQANIQRLTHEPADALYPQKINSTLFYMKRNMNNQITIVTQPWNPVAIDTYHDALLDHQIILQSSSQQLCFLRMISEHEGFYLQAPTKKKNKNNDSLEFSCHHLIKHNDTTWVTEQLFTFQIPAKYLIGSTRLYESLEPFLPNYNCTNMVYFVSWHNKTDQIEIAQRDQIEKEMPQADQIEIAQRDQIAQRDSFQLHAYNITTKSIESVCDSSIHRKYGQQIFAPYIHQDCIHCGFILQEHRNFESLQQVFEMDDVLFQLPYFKTKQ